MRNIKCILAYDGSRYLGWQKTEMGPSIEGELTLVLEQILQEKVQLNAASRTDAGVHAAGQVVNFFIRKPSMPLYKLNSSLNALLPKDIVSLNLEEVPAEFHPTLNSISKEYHYSLCCKQYQMPHLRHFFWHVPAQLNLEAMHLAAQHLVGEYDFSSFCNIRKNQQYDNYVRRLIRLEIIQLKDKQLRFEIEGDHFLYKMVRNLVGTLVYVGVRQARGKEHP